MHKKALGRVNLLTQALARGNLVKAWKRVKANGGSASVDGLTVKETVEYLKIHWPRIREELQDGRYRPQPVHWVEIPKSRGWANGHVTLQAQRHVQEGWRVVVESTWRSSLTGSITMFLWIGSRRYLEAGIMDGGMVMERYEGTPQGGPLSPLLANVLLDEVDRALEKRGNRFVRYGR